MTHRFRSQVCTIALIAATTACNPPPAKEASVPPPAPAQPSASAATSSTATTSGATDASNDAGTSATTSAPPPSPAPLLIAELETGRAAVLLGDGEGDDGDPREPLRVYVRGPIATVGRPIDETLLDADAKRALSKHYLVGSAKGATCDAALEAVATVGRIPDSDPTMGGHESDDDKTFARAVWGGDALGKKSGRARAHVALVRFAAPCKQPMFAVVDGGPYPTPLTVRALAKAHVATIKKALDKSVTSDASGKPRPLRAWSLGDGGPLWARAGQTAGDLMMSCGVMKDETSSSLAPQTPTCPDAVVGATRGPGETIDVWFAHARARIANGAIEMTYFPTDSFGSP
jgi:hypothetical protein